MGADNRKYQNNAKKAYTVILIFLVVVVTHHDSTIVIVGERVWDARTQNGDKSNRPRRYAGAASCGLVSINSDVPTENLSGEIVKNPYVDVSCRIYLWYKSTYIYSWTWFMLSLPRYSKLV